MKRYIITAKYANGDDFANTWPTLAGVIWELSDIKQLDHDGTDDAERVLANTVIIETEIEE